ncbi:NAD(P)H-hydrate dehydratase [Sneathiella limimaris]|uniref:NAD(P)H-hydrate dehydratase n=1 Tax=Sneathiella limimaris TaxID=1964213 RepID=UPI00146DE564|nr:NAD(P)H-hydrate dehydratase [Sneathiella limimaris]
MWQGPEILSIPEMYKADQLTIEAGIPGEQLMENAGAQVAAHITENWDICPALVLCGPGNNGGDGYVIARHLLEVGWPVTVGVFGDPAKLKGDAATMRDRCPLDLVPISELKIPAEGIVVDAVFGAGFRGTLPSELTDLFGKLQKTLDFIAVDIPSGVDGNTGESSEGTPPASLTVTFARPKTGHYLYPGRGYCGRLEVVDIGIPLSVIDQLNCRTVLNSPDIWGEDFPQARPTGHKYTRGHAAVMGGGISSTGAARISARIALRAGAGAVTLLSPPSALTTYAAALEAVMVKSVEDSEAFFQFLTDRRISAVLIGPGNGVTEQTRKKVEAALSSSASVILDADALTVFKGDHETLFDLIQQKKSGAVVLTPHEAEFARLFQVEGTALERCRLAAAKSGAIVLLKGASTVIAAPDGEAVINTHAPPWLATAGSGDALAGIITGLIATGMDTFLAVSAAAWIHGEAAYAFGPGLIAEDIEKQIPQIYAEIF